MRKHISAIIVEDEPTAIEILKGKLHMDYPNISVVAVCEDIASAKDSLELYKPDLVFFDISLHGENIFTLLQSFSTIKYQIIFITAYDHYALEAIKHCAVGYVLKPIDDSELKIAINNALGKIGEQKSIQENVEQVLQYMQRQTEKIALSTLEGMRIVHYSDIIYCEGDNKSTWIYLKGDIKLLSSYSIGYYKDLLANDCFFSIHRSYLVNLDHIQTYDKRGIILMSNKQELPVARNVKKDFLQSFKRI